MSESQQRILFIGGIAVILVGAVLAFAFGFKAPPSIENVNLEFWGVYDDLEFFDELIGEYTRNFPNVNIIYRQKNFDSYEDDLKDAFAANRGPDIWMMHNTWLPKHKDKISPLPSGEKWMTLKEFGDSFVDAAIEDLVSEGKIYALPLYVDTLALYWNKDLFQSQGIAEPPEDWDSFMKDVKILTKKDNFGNILRAGAAIGTARNINRSTDILALLMMQTGAQMIDDQNTQVKFNQSVSVDGDSYPAGEDALRFYTDFSDPQKDIYTWNPTTHYSIDAFYEGDAAMMINYSHHSETIKKKASYFNFGVAPIPQIKDSDMKIAYANYWAPTVYVNSKYPEWAWNFIQFLSSRDNVLKYLEKAKRPTARRDLVDTQKNELYLGVFAVQSLIAKSWYQIDNVAIENIFADMIESVVLGQATTRQAIDKAASQVNVLYRR